MHTDHRAFKDALYTQFARIGHAVSSPKRLELLDLLGQGEKTVEQLAEADRDRGQEHECSPARAPASAARRDPARRHVRLVPPCRRGRGCIPPRPPGPRPSPLRRGPGGRRVVPRAPRHLEPIPPEELRRRLDAGDVTLIDVRPGDEFAAGHIPGALSVPVAELRATASASFPSARRSSPTAVARTASFGRRRSSSCAARVPCPARSSRGSPSGERAGLRRRARRRHDPPPVPAHRPGDRRVVPRRLRRQAAGAVVDPVERARALPRAAAPWGSGCVRHRHARARRPSLDRP